MNKGSKRCCELLLMVFAFASAPSDAQHSHGGAQTTQHSGSGGTEHREARPPDQPQFFRGEVLAIDKASAQLTLKHEAIPVLDVPARTMSYSVKDISMLDPIKIGDAVRFTVVLQGRELLVTNVVPSP